MLGNGSNNEMVKSNLTFESTETLETDVKDNKSYCNLSSFENQIADLRGLK